MNTCFFCDNRPADAICTVEIPIYNLKRYAHQGLVRRFEYDRLLIPIDRCGECARLHARTKKGRRASIVTGAILGFIIGLAVPGAFLFSAIIGGYLGYLLSRARANKLYHRLHIKGLDAAALGTQPFIETKLKAGWTLKKR
jgi:hypothetical protein